MLKEKKLTITGDISAADIDKVFILRQIPAIEMKDLLFKFQNMLTPIGKDGSLSSISISMNMDVEKDLYYSLLAYILLEKSNGAKKDLIPMTKDNINSHIEDVDTMDYLVKEIWSFNLGGVGGKRTVLIESLSALLGALQA